MKTSNAWQDVNSSHPLLVGIKSGKVTLGNGLAVSHKTKHTATHIC